MKLMLTAGLTKDGSADPYEVIRFPLPCNGFIKNIQFQLYDTHGAQQHYPDWLYFVNHEFNNWEGITPASWAANTFLQQQIMPKRGQGVSVFMSTIDDGADTDQDGWIYHTNDRIYIKGGLINRLISTDYSPSTLNVLIVADFVPYPGAIFKQRFANATIDELSDGDDITAIGYWSPPVTLRDVVVDVNLRIVDTTDEIINLYAILVEPYEDLHIGNISSEGPGILADALDYAADEIHTHPNLLYSKDVGTSGGSTGNTAIHMSKHRFVVPNIREGQQLVIAKRRLSIGDTTTAPSVTAELNFTGKVNQKDYKNYSSWFEFSSNLNDISRIMEVNV